LEEQAVLMSHISPAARKIERSKIESENVKVIGGER
jgi:hypothetical protein